MLRFAYASADLAPGSSPVGAELFERLVAAVRRPGSASSDARAQSVAAAEAAAAAQADADDVAAVLGGDGDAYGHLVRRHQDRIARLMQRFTRDRGALEELVQDVFVEAYSSLGTWRAEAPLAHWLRRIAVRAGYRFWTARGRRPASLPAEWAEPVHDRHAADHELAEWLHLHLARLAPRDRLVLTLQSLEQHSVSEIAALTGWSPSLVKVAAHRARKRLRALLEGDPS